MAPANFAMSIFCIETSSNAKVKKRGPILRNAFPLPLGPKSPWIGELAEFSSAYIAKQRAITERKQETPHGNRVLLEYVLILS
jgi:hypothetical protein